MEVGNGAPPIVAEKKEQERKSQEKIKKEAYDFDPNAPPEEKAAQMKKVRNALLCSRGSPSRVFPLPWARTTRVIAT